MQVERPEPVTPTPTVPLPLLTAEQDELLRVAFHELMRSGGAVPVSALSTRCASAGIDAVRELPRLAAGGRIGRGTDGSVTGALGLTVEQTRHELFIGVTRWHTWCVIDALGILGALDASGTTRSREPGTGRSLEVTFCDGLPTAGDLQCVVLVPDYEQGTSVIAAWCPSVNFFPDAGAAERWAAARSIRGRAVPLALATAGAARRWRERLRVP